MNMEALAKQSFKNYMVMVQEFLKEQEERFCNYTLEKYAGIRKQNTLLH